MRAQTHMQIFMRAQADEPQYIKNVSSTERKNAFINNADVTFAAKLQHGIRQFTFYSLRRSRSRKLVLDKRAPALTCADTSGKHLFDALQLTSSTAVTRWKLFAGAFKQETTVNQSFPTCRVAQAGA